MHLHIIWNKKRHLRAQLTLLLHRLKISPPTFLKQVSITLMVSTKTTLREAQTSTPTQMPMLTNTTMASQSALQAIKMPIKLSKTILAKAATLLKNSKSQLLTWSHWLWALQDSKRRTENTCEIELSLNQQKMKKLNSWRNTIYNVVFFT